MRLGFLLAPAVLICACLGNVRAQAPADSLIPTDVFIAPTIGDPDGDALAPCDIGDANTRFYFEAGFNLVRPVFRHSAAVTVGRPASAFGPAGVGTSSFRYDLSFAPRLTLGMITPEGYGFQASWWQLDSRSVTLGVRNASPTAGTMVITPPLPDIPGIVSPSALALGAGTVNDFMNFNSRVKVTAFDWEGLVAYKHWGWNVRNTLGVRYAYVSQDYQAMRVNAGPTGTGTTGDSDLIAAGHNFSGVGPTTLMVVRRPIGKTNIHLFFSDRLSVLFGDQNQRTTQLSQTFGPGGVASAAFGASSTQTVCVPVEDIEAGFEWARDVGDARVFCRAAFIDQQWFDVGTPVNLHGNMSIVGLGITSGITY